MERRHIIDTVVCRNEKGFPIVLEVEARGRNVVLVLPNDLTLSLTLANYDRLKQKLTIAGVAASWVGEPLSVDRY